MKTKAAVVILNWNGQKFLEQFLPPLIRHTFLPGVALIVADNGSTDDSETLVRRRYPSIRWIGLDQNYGFTGGYNRALQQVDAQYYILLNSDVEVTDHWLQPLLALMDSRPEVAVCAPKIRAFARRNYFEYAGAAGGFIDKYGYPFCRGRLLNRLEEDRGQYDDPCPVFWASGACLLVRAETYRRLGGFDERFFAHMEEIDFCWRVKQHGGEILCCPQSTVYHVGGGTLPNENSQKLYLNYRNSLLMLYKNLPDSRRPRILTTRLLLDALSALVYLLTGKGAAFLAVWKAHRSFRRLRRYVRTQRTPERNNPVAGVYNKSILWQRYVRRKTTITMTNEQWS